MSKKEDVQIIDAFSGRKVNHIEPVNRMSNTAQIITGIAIVCMFAGVGIFMFVTMNSVFTNIITATNPVYGLFSFFPIIVAAMISMVVLKMADSVFRRRYSF